MPDQASKNYYRVGNASGELAEGLTPEELRAETEKHRKEIEPWLSAIFQSEHLSLLVGSGFSTAVCSLAGTPPASMDKAVFDSDHAPSIDSHAQKTAELSGRGKANIEDQLRSAIQLVNGLEVIQSEELSKLQHSINRVLKKFLTKVVSAEGDFKAKNKLISSSDGEGTYARNVRVSFLLSFASRAASRERLHVFTTNYDRFIEYGCDEAGIHLLDRFVGCVQPIFRSSRLELDIHYNPPGIRNEPRFLEGVVRFTKLHGSIDWLMEQRELKRILLPFGVDDKHPSFPEEPLSTVIVYPNAAKDWETSGYPYADLFRDFSSALCRPNSVLVTYGYGFGDDHINRVIADMLTLQSTHLVIIAFDDPDGRIEYFCKNTGRIAQTSIMMGNHFGGMDVLVKCYLPKPAIDLITSRHVNVLENRGLHPTSSNPERGGEK